MQTEAVDPLIRAAGGFALVSALISAAGVVFLLALYILLFATPYRELGLTFGLLNDICASVQYLLTIPIALALYRILLPHNPSLIRAATIVGVSGMVAVILLQLALVFGVLTFGQQLPWVSAAMLLGVGSWLVISGLVARETGRLPNSVLMSALAVPYFGYPLWAFWLGRRLLAW